jgi:hypothetical protein
MRRNSLTDGRSSFACNSRMANERPQSLPPKDRDQPPRQQEKAGRSGEGSRSVLPHLKADQRARAVARIAKREEREW